MGKLLCSVVLVATLSLGYMARQAYLLERKLIVLQQRLARLENEPVTATETWTSGSTTVSVSTTRIKNDDGGWAETTSEWAARHAADVAAAKAVFPPNAP